MKRDKKLFSTLYLTISDTMKIKLLFFAQLREQFGTERVADVAEGTRLNELASQMGLNEPSLQFAVNEEFAAPETLLKEEDTVAFLMPMSGGSQDG